MSKRLMLVVALLGGCAGATRLAAEPSAATPAPPVPQNSSGPPQLVCQDQTGRLVVATADGQRQAALHAQPPQELVALAAAGDTLVGVSQGQVWALLAEDGGKRWRSVAHWDPSQWSAEPLRAASYGASAVVWMRGNDPGTVPAALLVTAQGQVITETVSVAERSLGGIWQSSYAPAGSYDKSFPGALRLLVAQVRMSGAPARAELLHSERSPWGGRLVAPNLGLELRGDWPDAPLYYVGAAPDAPPVPLQYKSEPLLFRGLIGYGASARLYLDGRFSALGKGVLVVEGPGSPGQGGKGRRPLEAQVVSGLRPPCAVVYADWRE